jgi:hypothetical protein
MPIDNGSVNQQVKEALKPKGDRRKAKAHTETVSESQAASNGAVSSVSAANKAGLSNVAAHIERVKADREDAIEQVATVIAYLYDPRVFEAEVFTRASSKLHGAATGDYTNPYEGFDVQPPCLPSVISAGYLPM